MNLTKQCELMLNHVGIDTDYILTDVFTKIEYLHIRGNMFAFYKKGTSPVRKDGRLQDKGVQLMKPGKLLGQITEYADDRVERFVNKLKSYVSMCGDEHGDGIEAPEFSFVAGEMIAHYYHEDRYVTPTDSESKKSNLIGSCMRGDHCNQFFNIYEGNPDVIGMLILRNSDRLIVARALVWTWDGKSYMDTIYHLTEKHREAMIEYAIQHGWHYKSQQSCHYFAFDMFGGQRVQAVPLTITLRFDPEWAMPWLDTMMYGRADGDELTLTNCPTPGSYWSGRMLQFRTTSGATVLRNAAYESHAEWLKYAETCWQVIYNQDRFDMPEHVSQLIAEYPNVITTWQCDDKDWNKSLAELFKNPGDDSRIKRIFKAVIEHDDDDDEDEVYVESRDAYFHIDDTVWSDYHNEHLHIDDAERVGGDWYHTDSDRIRYSEYHGEYFLEDDVTWVDSRGDYFLNDRTCWDEHKEEEIFDGDAVYVEDYGYVHKDNINDVAVEFDDVWYRKSDCFTCADTGELIKPGDEVKLPDGRTVSPSAAAELESKAVEEAQDEEEN